MKRCVRCFAPLHLEPDLPRPCCNTCRNCASDKRPFRKGRCPACAEHYRRTGQERPMSNVERHVERVIERKLERESLRPVRDLCHTS